MVSNLHAANGRAFVPSALQLHAAKAFAPSRAKPDKEIPCHLIARTDGLAANHAIKIRMIQLVRLKRIVRLKSTSKPAKAKEKGAIPNEESILKLITLPSIAGGVRF